LRQSVAPTKLARRLLFQFTPRTSHEYNNACPHPSASSGNAGSTTSGSPARRWRTTRCATPRPARARSSFRVGNTALGPIAFLACEAIGGTITLAYGFPNAVWAIVAFTVLMFLIGLPIAYYAARYGVDIDLLTRGAGFGYLGSTITSLIYASFTFLLFSIEASILSVALQMLFGIPLALAHVISSLVVIPIAVYGISLISRMQLATQPIWLALQFLPIAYIVYANHADVAAWTHFGGGTAAGRPPRAAARAPARPPAAR
jgi:hypothetical protein